MVGKEAKRKAELNGMFLHCRQNAKNRLFIPERHCVPSVLGTTANFLNPLKIAAILEKAVIQKKKRISNGLL